MAEARLTLTVDTTHAEDLAGRVTTAIADTFAAARSADTAEEALIELTASAVMAEVLRLRNEATHVRLAAELARLHEGEEPVTSALHVATPGQWIWRWNRATPEQRLEAVQDIQAAAAQADRCFQGGHVMRLDQQQARITRLEADAASSDEAARRAMEQRQQMATERYALQEQRDQLAAAVYRAELAIEDYRGSLSHALGLGTSAPWDAIHARAAELHRALNRAEAKAADYDDYGNRQQARAETAEHRRTELAATLHDVLRHFVHPGHPGEPCLGAGWISVKTVARWRAVLNPPATVLKESK